MVEDEPLFPLVSTPAGLELPEELQTSFEFISARRFESAAVGRAVAVVSPLLKHLHGVDDSDRARETKLTVLAVLADHGGDGLTFVQICQTLHGRFTRGEVEAALRVMQAAGTVQRARKNDTRITPTIQAALSIALMPTLADLSGHRALLEMFDRTQLLAGEDVSAPVLADAMVRLRYMLSIYTTDAYRVAQTGSAEEVLTHTRADDHVLISRFNMLSAATPEGEPLLMRELEALNRAVYGYVDAAKELQARVQSSRRRLADARLLPVEDYQRAVKVASVARLAALFDGILFDTPPSWVDPEVVEEVTAMAVGAAQPVVVPEPVSADGEHMPAALTLLERWRLRADEMLLADGGEVDLVTALAPEPWPGPAVVVAEFVALSLADNRYHLDRSGVALAISAGRDATILSPGTLTFGKRPIPAQRELPDDQPMTADGVVA
ncbi:hypothetical protein [Longispora albida]|uniref:hypothetical protein n=1 Tax=Longispora albida TaxID=203523 RepID=UPI000370CC39|nr:hypothetical protein [Longispora albida]